MLNSLDNDAGDLGSGPKDFSYCNHHTSALHHSIEM